MISYLDIKTGMDRAVTLSMPLPQPYLIGGTIMAKSVVSKRAGSSQVKKTCQHCGVVFWVISSKADKRKYCGYDCYHESMKHEKLVLNCSHCGKEILVDPWKMKSNKTKRFFCDKSCQLNDMVGDGNPNKRAHVDLKCKNCGEIFSRPPNEAINKRTGEKREFCSIACCNEYRTGKNNPAYKGGAVIDDRPLYETYNDQISFRSETRRSNEGFLNTKCSYCGKWFEPSRKDIVRKIQWSKNHCGDLNLYCSDACKEECPVYRRTLYPKGFKRASSREVSPDLRQMCLERDGWECQRCGKTEPPLHCHHIDGAVQNKIISNDLENVITLCKACHKEVHKQDGCRYHELQCKEKESWAA